MTLVPTSRNDSAVSRIRTISSALTSWIDSRCAFTFGPPPSPLARHRFVHEHRVLAVDLPQGHPHVPVLAGRHVLADEVGADRQLAVSPVDEHRELDRGRAPEVDERVEPSGSSAP